MTIRLSPAVLIGAYEFLRATPPFHRWKLPDSDDVEFRVVREPLYGFHQEGDHHIIGISEKKVGHTDTLIATMAHELIHLHQAMKGTTDKGEHGPEFRKLAAQVCKLHGFDPKSF